jgi:beta-glucosidase
VFNDCILDYLGTGRFRLWLPGLVALQHDNVLGSRSLDYIGLNYYSHLHLQCLLHRPFHALRYAPGDVMTDMPYAMYPEGFYRALHQVRRLGVPILVTENGIADARDDRRALFVERYLYALYRALRDGCDVQGYFYWSLMDNFEWAEGYDMKFGLYEVDFTTQQRRLRPGAQAFVRTVKGEGRDGLEMQR